MKRYILSLVLILGTAISFAAPAPYAHLQTYDYISKSFFKKFILNEKATYKVCVDNYIPVDSISEEEANEIFLEAIDNWFSKTQHFISKSKSEKDLADISDILERDNLIQQVSCDEPADLEISFTNNSNKCSELGIFNAITNTIYISTIRNTKRAEYVHSLSHELGHAFGLADQYAGAIGNGSFLYNSKVKRPSIMDAVTKKVTCDDADGLITSIDRILEKPREFYSVCKDGLFIKNGKGQIKANRKYNFIEEYNLFDMEAVVSYNTGIDDSYILDITLTNFILNDKGIELLNSMGFEVSNVETLKNAVVKIHGMANEKFSQTEYLEKLKQPTGLWTLVLYEGANRNLYEKQVVTKEYSDNDNIFTFKQINENEQYMLGKIKIPLINFLPFPKDGIKEILRNRESTQNKERKTSKEYDKNSLVGSQVQTDISTSLRKLNL